MLGAISHAKGDLGAAFSLYEEGLEARLSMGDRAGAAFSLGRLGAVAIELGEHEEAEDLLRESRDIRRELGDLAGAALAHSGLGANALAQLEYATAGEHYDAALRAANEAGADDIALGALAGKAAVLLRNGHWKAAAEILYYVLNRPDAPSATRAHAERLIAALQAKHTTRSLAHPRATGRARELEEIVALALVESVQP
jgi:tetratricopeptide (TPR) repeat protein